MCIWKCVDIYTLVRQGQMLNDRLKGKSSHNKAHEEDQLLTHAEEKELVWWITCLIITDYPPWHRTLWEMIQEIRNDMSKMSMIRIFNTLIMSQSISNGFLISYNDIQSYWPHLSLSDQNKNQFWMSWSWSALIFKQLKFEYYYMRKLRIDFSIKDWLWSTHSKLIQFTLNKFHINYCIDDSHFFLFSKSN